VHSSIEDDLAFMQSQQGKESMLLLVITAKLPSHLLHSLCYNNNNNNNNNKRILISVM